MAREVIPVAYVTKWAKTRGVVVWENALVTGAGAVVSSNYGRGSHAYVSAKEWTTDKAVAEERWRQAVETEAKRLKLAAKKYEALAKGAPVYAKEEG
jgi:hypothetical protein